MKPITSLTPNQIFVFGSGSQGFHGAGSAGFAMRGTSSNTWRTDESFLKAMRAPVDSPDRIGKWAVYGISRGFQQGREGMSYAIETIRRPGEKRSTPLNEIEDQIVDLFYWAENHAAYEVLFTSVGCGLSGYTEQEMADTLRRAVKRFGYVPKNVVILDDLYDNANWRET